MCDEIIFKLEEVIAAYKATNKTDDEELFEINEHFSGMGVGLGLLSEEEIEEEIEKMEKAKMQDKKTAPTIMEIKEQEAKKVQEENRIRQEQDNRIRKKKEAEDEKNAELIINQLAEMFAGGNVSGEKGCSIRSIPVGICTDGVLTRIDNYLDGEWSVEFTRNTGSIHDFEITNTLVVKPEIKV